MKNLIRGDIRRIMCKKSLWVVFAIALIADIIIVMIMLNARKYTALNFLGGNHLALMYFSGLILGAAIFLAVYADDFKAMTLISIIGRGNSRLQVVIAKFINSVIITFILYAIYGVMLMIMTKVVGMELSGEETLVLWMSFAGAICLAIGYVTMSAIIIYASNNMPFSIFMIVMLYLVIPIVLDRTGSVPILQNAHIDRYHFGSLISSGLSDILLGMPVKGVFVILEAFVFYVGGSLAIIYAVFRKKELDF